MTGLQLLEIYVATINISRRLTAGTAVINTAVLFTLASSPDFNYLPASPAGAGDQKLL